MKKVWLIVLAILVVVILAAIYLVGMYNGLVKDSQNIDGAWAQVETQYQRRFDLIPNLVASVKGAMTQEQKVFSDITDARTRYSGAQTVNDKISATNQVESSLARLLVVMENYPQLKSIDTVQTLMVQLEGTENRISVERSRFNDMVNTYNTKIKSIPTNIFASMFGFSEKTYFESQNGAQNAPSVNF